MLQSNVDPILGFRASAGPQPEQQVVHIFPFKEAQVRMQQLMARAIGVQGKVTHINRSELTVPYTSYLSTRGDKTRSNECRSP